MKFFATMVVVACLVSVSAKAEDVDFGDYADFGSADYDAMVAPCDDFCKVIQANREALELNRRLIEKSETIRQSIDRQLKQELEKLRTRH